jgi:hypothetical protein
MAWFGADRTTAWIEAERENLARQLAASGTLNREAFRNAWEKLQPLGGQDDLTAPAEGGNELRLRSEEDAKVVAYTAADIVKRPLLIQGPFSFGAPCIVRDPGAVASDVVAAIPAPAYPVKISPNNEWSRAAVTAQVGTALESASKALFIPTQELKFALVWFGALLLFIQIVLIPITAVGDIKENPKA